MSHLVASPRATDVFEYRAGNADAGVALILVLLLTGLLSAAGMALLVMVDVETTIVANHTGATRVVLAAEGAAELAMSELARTDDWTTVLNGTVTSRLQGPPVLPPAAGGLAVDVPALTSEAQRMAYGAAWWGSDTPAWRVFGLGVPAFDVPIAGLPDDVYVIIWVSDDTGESDGDPQVDSNQTVVVRVRAIGPRRARADVQAVVESISPGVVRRVSSRLIR